MEEKTILSIDKSFYATAGTRFGNFVIDMAACYIIIFLMGLLFGLLTYVEIYGPYIWITELSESETEFMGYGFYLLYYFIFESLTQRSVAKFITGTKIVMADGSKPHVGIIFVRTLCRLIPFDFLTFFWGTFQRMA